MQHKPHTHTYTEKRDGFYLAKYFFPLFTGLSCVWISNASMQLLFSLWLLSLLTTFLRARCALYFTRHTVDSTQFHQLLYGSRSTVQGCFYVFHLERPLDHAMDHLICQSKPFSVVAISMHFQCDFSIQFIHLEFHFTLLYCEYFCICTFTILLLMHTKLLAISITIDDTLELFFFLSTCFFSLHLPHLFSLLHIRASALLLLVSSSLRHVREAKCSPFNAFYSPLLISVLPKCPAYSKEETRFFFT